MSGEPTIKRNMVWNSAGLVVETAAGFLVMPFLIAKLGNTTYGVWLVLGALTSYFGLLELGVRGAIGRHIALYHSQHNQTSVNQTLTSGLAALLGAGGLAFLILVLGERWFFQFYDVPADRHSSVSLAFRLVAANFVIVLVSAAFDSTLWGFQRFDWINAVGIPVAFLRLGLTFALVRSSEDLVVLAYLTVALSGVSGLCKAFLSYRANPRLRIGLHYLNRSSLRQLFGYGSWNAIRTVAQLSRTQLGPILIGAILGLGLVPLFSVANRLLTTVGAAIVSVTGVLTPHATALHATNQVDRQRALFLNGGRRITALGLFLCAYLLMLGGDLINLWVGPSFAPAITLLVILVLGELLPSTQFVTNGIILATARHRSLALFASLEAVAVCGLMVVLLPALGIIGAGLSVAIPAFFARGVAPMIQGCRILEVPLLSYLKQAILPPMLSALPAAVVIGLVDASFPARTWPVFVVYSVAYVALFGISYICLNRVEEPWGIPRQSFVPNSIVAQTELRDGKN